MNFWLAGSISAGLAWLINGFIVKRMGERAIVWFVPALEETLKTGTALVLRTSVPLTHGVFGLIEAIHDYIYSKKWGLLAGVLSVIGHWIFGYGAMLGYGFSGNWWVGVITAWFIHTLWNHFMVFIFAKLSRVNK